MQDSPQHSQRMNRNQATWSRIRIKRAVNFKATQRSQVCAGVHYIYIFATLRLWIWLEKSVEAFLIQGSSNSPSQIKGSLGLQRRIWFLSCRTNLTWAVVYVCRYETAFFYHHFCSSDLDLYEWSNFFSFLLLAFFLSDITFQWLSPHLKVDLSKCDLFYLNNSSLLYLF